MKGRSATLAAVLLASTTISCSTIADEGKSRICEIDSDCSDPELVCNAGLCTKNRLPARDPIALDVRSEPFGEPPFRVEILGNDAALVRYLDEKPYRYRVSLDNGDTNAGVRDRLFIALTETRKRPQEGETTLAPLAGRFTLSQGSRLGRSTLKSPPITYPPQDSEGKPLEGTPSVEQPWPRYAATDERGELPLILEISPSDDEAPAAPGNDLYGRGLIYRQVQRKNIGMAGQHNLSIASVRECHRRIDATLRFPEGLPTLPPLMEGETEPTISVSLRHAGRLPDDDPKTLTCDPNPSDGGTPALCSIDTVVPQPADQCESSNQCAEPFGCHTTPMGDEKRCGCVLDGECPAGQFCNVEHHLCALDLTDRPATKTFDLTTATTDFTPWVYTYCDDDYTAPHQIEFIVTADPDSRLGLPRLSFRRVLDFYYDSENEPSPTSLPPLCLPTWSPVLPIELRLTQQPAELYTDPRGRPWVCCDTGCINPSAPAVSDIPTSCTLRADLSATTTFAIDPASAMKWDACLPPESFTGSLNIDDCTTDDSACLVKLSPGSPGGSGQEYRLRIEPPSGSIFRSETITAQVSDESPIDIPLPYRVLVRGKVMLQDCIIPPEGGTCTPEAEIVAERIIRDELADIESGASSEDLLGPFFFTTSTLPDTPGEYVLPLNPGLYLITALPKITIGTSSAAPAPIQILDVRPGSKLVQEKNGVPVAAAPDLLLAPSGETFTLEFDDFDLSTRIIPLDQTSWTNGNKGIGYEFEDYKLSEPGVCDKTGGCKIRRLRPGNSPVYLTRERFLNYVMRPAAEPK